MRAQEQGFLLLTSSLGNPNRQPLTVAQFRTLAKRVAAMEKPLGDRELTSSDLVKLGYAMDTAQRILGLLRESDVLEYYLKAGERGHCVPLTRVSEKYPLLLRKRLGLDSPGCLWAKGDISLLERPGISLVGSRDLQPANREFARKVGQQAAQQGFVLISGNARGADREAQNACVKSGGYVISIIADDLQRQPLHERVLYLSEDGFDLPFSSRRALSRNRVIHALGWRTLVAQSSDETGGTWDGSVKNLRHGWSPLFCFDDGSGAVRKLCDMGAETVSMEMLGDFGALQENSMSLFDQ